MSAAKPRGVLVVIPARLGSTRFPGKVLARLGGAPVVEWCRRAAVAARCGPVLVATDHPSVAEAVRRAGGRAVLTSPRCRSGSDRAWEALRIAERERGRRFRAVVNVQGDEPFVKPATIRAVARLAEAGARGKAPVDIATAVAPLRPEAGADPNVVKAVVSRGGRCLYFSRAPVPYGDARAPGRLQHIGIYGFTRAALARFVRLKPSELERRERLEQLRALEAGMTLAAARVRERTLGIDTPADLARARKRLGRHRNG